MECPECGGQAYSMGSLGNVVWFRCQDCGMEFCVPASQVTSGDDDEE